MDRLTHEITETPQQGLRDATLHGIKAIGELMEGHDPMVRLQATRAAVIF